jgi:hypothetical protein
VATNVAWRHDTSICVKWGLAANELDRVVAWSAGSSSGGECHRRGQGSVELAGDVAPYGGGVGGFFVGHCGYHYASTALMDPMTKAFVADIHGFVSARGLELVSFAKGQRKDDLAQQFLARFTDEEGVLFVGRAQEKAGVWRTQRRYSASRRGQLRLARPLLGVHQLLLLLLRGRRLRPVLPQVQHLTNFPYTAKLCINGNEWANRRPRTAHQPLDAVHTPDRHAGHGLDPGERSPAVTRSSGPRPSTTYSTTAAPVKEHRLLDSRTEGG